MTYPSTIQSLCEKNLKSATFSSNIFMSVFWGIVSWFLLNSVHAGEMLPFVHVLDRNPSNRDIVVDSSGNLYTVGTSECVVYKFIPTPSGYWQRQVFAGAISASPGICPGFTAGSGSSARFGRLNGTLAIDKADNLYLIDGGVLADTSFKADPKLVKITPAGAASSIPFDWPGFFDVRVFIASIGAIAINNKGEIYLNTGIIRKLGLVAGKLTMQYFVGDDVIRCSKFTPGTGKSACFGGGGPGGDYGFPLKMTFDENDNLYVTVTNVGIAKITSSAAMDLFAGTPYSFGSNDGARLSAKFNYPSSIAYANGTLVVGDSGIPNFNGAFLPILGGGTIRSINLASGLVATLAGTALAFDYQEGNGAAARFLDSFNGIALDNSGNTYVGNTDYAGTRPVAIRKIDAAATTSTLMGIVVWCGFKPC